MNISRRTALRLSGVSLCGGLAGCTSYNPLRQEPAQARISGITIVNLDTEPHLFDIMIRDVVADSIVFWERYTADGATKADEGYTISGGTYWERPVSGPGEYVLHADADRDVAENDSQWDTADVTRDIEEEGDCVGLDVGIGREGYLYIATKWPESC